MKHRAHLLIICLQLRNHRNTLLSRYMSNVLPFPSQPDLRLILPTIAGNVDYLQFRQQLERIDQLLGQSGVETQCIKDSLKRWLDAREEPARPPSSQEQIKHQEWARRALRCNISRVLMQEGVRGFSMRMADSPLLQWFCGVDRLDVVRVPSKSELQRFSAWLPRPRCANSWASYSKPRPAPPSWWGWPIRWNWTGTFWIPPASKPTFIILSTGCSCGTAPARS